MNALDLTNPNLLKLNYKFSCFKTHQIIMTMNDSDQMNECFAEMERLKVKMETLEQQRKINEENETLRKTTMEPNLKVLENWLVDYREAIELNKARRKEGQHHYQRYSYDNIKAASINGKCTGHYYNEPSDVMKAHIEATYNMFNIINKRLDDIDKKLALFDYVNELD